MSWEDVPDNELPEQLRSVKPPTQAARVLPGGQWEDVPESELPEELKPEGERISPVMKTASNLLGGAISRIGKSAGLPNVESMGEDIKKTPGYVGLMKAIYGDFVDIPANLVRGLTWNYAPKVETPVDAGMLHKTISAATHLFGMGLGVAPVGKAAGGVIRGAGVVSGAARGAATGGVYGLLSAPEDEETRLGNLFKYAVMFGTFEGAGGLIEKLATRIPEVGKVFEKIKLKLPLSKREQHIHETVKMGRSVALGGGAGAIEPAATWDERVRNVVVGMGTFGLAHLGNNLFMKAMGSLKSKEQKLPVGAKLDIEKALSDITVPPEQRRMAAEILLKRVMVENPKDAEHQILWRNYVEDAIKNDKPISVMEYDKSLLTAVQDYYRSTKLLGWQPKEGVKYGKGFTMVNPEEKTLTFTDDNGIVRTVNVPDSLRRFGEVLQGMPEFKSDEQILNSYRELLREKPGFLLTADEKIILGAKEEPKIVMGSVIIGRPEVEKVKDIETGEIKKISAEDVARLRAKRILEGKTELAINIPEQEKDTLFSPASEKEVVAIERKMSGEEGKITKQPYEMTEDELKNWEFEVPEGGASKTPKTVFGWRESGEQLETLDVGVKIADDFMLNQILGDNKARIVKDVKEGKPINIYRDVIKGTTDTIAPGAYVTESREYAEKHGETILKEQMGQDYDIIEDTVKPSELMTYGDAHEFIYVPESVSAYRAKVVERAISKGIKLPDEVLEKMGVDVTPVNEETPIEYVQSGSPMLITEAFKQKNKAILETKAVKTQRALFDTKEFIDSGFYDYTYPIPREGGIVAARRSKLYKDNAQYREKIEQTIEDMTDTYVRIKKQMDILTGLEGTSGAFGVDYNLQYGDPNKETATQTCNMSRAWFNEAKDKYSSWRLGNVGLRETLQNSVDAVLKAIKLGMIKKGKIDLGVTLNGNLRRDYGNGYFCEDNGTGMDSSTLKNIFLSLYSTGKEGERSFGIFGIAKAVILGCARRGTKWKVFTKDNYFDDEMSDRNDHIGTIPERKGTRLEINAQDDTEFITDNEAINFIETTDVGKNIEITFNEEVPKNPFKGFRHSTTTLDFNHSKEPTQTKAEVKYFPKAPPGYEHRRVIRLVDKERGVKLTQGIKYLGDKFPGAIMIDIETFEKAGTGKYPLQNSREELRGELEEHITRIVTDKVADTERAGREAQKFTYQLMRDRSNWKGTVDRLPNDRIHKEIVEEIESIWKEEFPESADEYDKYTPIDQMEVKIDKGYKGKHGGNLHNARLITIFETLSRLLSAKGLNMPMNKFYTLLAKPNPETGGTVAAEFGMGEMGFNYMLMDKTMFKNPTCFAKGMVDLVEHELTHWKWGKHDENFTSGLNSTQKRTAFLFPHAIKLAQIYMQRSAFELENKIWKPKNINEVDIATGKIKSDTTPEAIAEKQLEDVLNQYFEPEQLDLLKQGEQDYEERVRLYTPKSEYETQINILKRGGLRSDVGLIGKKGVSGDRSITELKGTPGDVETYKKGLPTTEIEPGEIEGGGLAYEQLKSRITEKGYGATEDANKMGMILPSGEGVDMSKGHNVRWVSHAQFGRDVGFKTIPSMMRESKMVGVSTLGEELLIRSYTKPTPEQLMTIQNIFKQVGKRLTHIQYGFDKSITIKDATFEDVSKILDKISIAEDTPNGEIKGGGLSYEQLKGRIEELYNSGKTSLSSVRDAIRAEVSEKEMPQYGMKIVKAFREVSEGKNTLTRTEDGYEIDGQRAGNQGIDTFMKDIARDMKEDFTETKDELYSWVTKGYERAVDFFSKTPKSEQEKIADQMVKNLGFGKYLKFKVSEWAKVPIWDVELAPVVKSLRGMTQRATEIKNGFLEKLQFLKHYKISKDMQNILANTSLYQEKVGWERLSPEEQKVAEKIYEATDWMWNQFEHEWRQNAPYLEKYAKAQGYKNADEYITEQIESRKRKFYLPFVRSKGDYVVYMKDPKNGKTKWAENFDTPNEAKERIVELKTKYPDNKIGAFDVKARYGGYNMPKLVEMLHDVPYMKKILASRNVSEEAIQELDDMFSGAYLDVWAKGRMQKREDILGFNRNWIEVLNDYADYFPRSFVRRFNSKAMAKLVETVPEDKKGYAMNLIDFYLGRKDYEGNVNFALRNLIFNWNLMLKPSFALINLTQRGQTTFWKALKELPKGGAGIFLKSHAKELSFYREAIGKKFQGMSSTEIINSSNVLSKTEKEVVNKLHETGEMEAIRNLEIIGRNKLSRVLNIFSTMSEKSNRLNAALTGTEIGIRKGYKGEELFDYVNDFINRTQWMYGKENRPVIGRGWKAPLFVFKTYVLNDLNFLKDMYPNKKLFAGAVSMRLALAGLGGVYGMGLISSAIDAAMIHIVGKKDWELSKYETRQMLNNKFGKGMVDVATKGLPSVAGIEGSVTYGSAELFDIAGVPLFKGSYDNLKMALSEKGIDWNEFIRKNAPATVKHALGFSNQTLFGKPKITADDIKHLPPEMRKRAMQVYRTMPKDMGDKEKFLYSIGFSTTTPNDIYEALNAIKATSYKVKKYKAGVHMEIARALIEGKREDIKNLIEDAREHGIVVNRQAIERQAGLYKQAELMEEEME